MSNVSIGHSIADDGQSAVHGECFDFFLKKKTKYYMNREESSGY